MNSTVCLTLSDKAVLSESFRQERQLDMERCDKHSFGVLVAYMLSNASRWVANLIFLEILLADMQSNVAVVCMV